MIYLDNNATTFLDPSINDLLHSINSTLLGNPGSTHRFGQQAKSQLADAQRRCALFFGVKPEEIIFTSGATEALNLLLSNSPKQGHVITSSLEHSAVLEPLKRCGALVTYLDPLPGSGAVTAAQIQAAIQINTSMIVLSAANNETGIKIELNEIAALAQKTGIAFVVDGVSWLGKDRFSLPSGVLAVCFSGHKIHGPLGVGVAIVRKPFKVSPLIVGGGQQRGVRAGTENLPAILGFARALELLDDTWIIQMSTLRNRFEEGILAHLTHVIIHGKNEPRVCNTSNIAFLGVDGETLVMALDLAGVAASHGSACSSGALESSRVLRAMGIESRMARCSLRFSLSRFTTEAEIDQSIAIIKATVSRLRRV